MSPFQIFGLAASTCAITLLTPACLATHEQSEAPDIKKVDWTPPTTTIPADYVKAAKELLGNGLGDPRGGSFKRVKITLGDAAWSRTAATQGLGWVGKDGKHAVLMDGVDYKIDGIVGPANLDETIAQECSTGTRRPGGGNQRTRPIMGFTVEYATAATPALLLIVGRTDLAEKLFSAQRGNAENTAFQLYNHLALRLQMLTADCLINMRDREGLGWANELLKVSTLEQRNGVKSSFPGTGPERPTVASATQLRDDLKRRVAHPKKEPVDVVAIAKLAKQDQIKALIEAFDTVGARQWGQPGGIDYSQDPVFKALVNEGTEATPALIDAIESDNRMTRTVSFGRDFFPDRQIHPVRDTAWMALLQVWPSASTYKRDSPAATAKALRDVWQTQGKLTESERWLNVLRDDKAPARSWLAAAQFLTRPANTPYQQWLPDSKKQPQPMAGESLRTSHGDEVTKLLGDRSIKMETDYAAQGANITYGMGEPLQLGHCLAKWNLEASVEPLRTLTQKAFDVVQLYKQSPGALNDQLSQAFGILIADRMRAGDKTAAADYKKLTESLDLTQQIPVGFFQPLWTSHADPAVIAVAEDALDKMATRINGDDLSVASRILYYNSQYLRSPLIVSSAFRRFLVKSIGAQREIGTAWVQGQQGQPSLMYDLGNKGSGGMSAPKGVAVKPDSARVKISVGDLLSQHLAGIPGAPGFAMVWPEAQRSEAKKALIEWLKDDSRDWSAIAEQLHYWDPGQ